MAARADGGEVMRDERSLSRAFAAMATDRHNYGALDRAAVQRAIAAAEEIVERTIGFAPAEEQPGLRKAVERKIAFLKGVTFEDVNGFSRSSPDYDAFEAEHMARFANGQSIHLELGSYVTWPDNKKEEYISVLNLGDMIRLDMNAEFGPDVVASVTALPFADESIDIISSNSLFEHVAYPHEIIRESFRVLRPGGVLRTTVPFHYVVHGCPHDYLRYTPQFFDEVSTAVGFTNVRSDSWACSGTYYTLHQLLKGVLASDDAPTGRAGQMTHLTMMASLAALQGFDDFFVGGGANHHQATRALAVKPGAYTPPARAPDRTRPFADRFDAFICPASGLPLRRLKDELVSLDGAHRYPIVAGIPNLFVLHGFGSAFARARPSSRDRLRRFERSRPFRLVRKVLGLGDERGR